MSEREEDEERLREERAVELFKMKKLIASLMKAKGCVH